MTDNKVKFFLNDKQVEASKDETIWQVAIDWVLKYHIYAMQINLVTELMEIVELVWLKLRENEY